MRSFQHSSCSSPVSGERLLTEAYIRAPGFVGRHFDGLRGTAAKAAKIRQA